MAAGMLYALSSAGEPCDGDAPCFPDDRPDVSRGPGSARPTCSGAARRHPILGDEVLQLQETSARSDHHTAALMKSRTQRSRSRVRRPYTGESTKHLIVNHCRLTHRTHLKHHLDLSSKELDGEHLVRGHLQELLKVKFRATGN